MGFVNPRARCPSCGAKIHTQAKGIGHLAAFWRSSWMLRAGSECPECGTELTGRIKPGGTAEAIGEPEARAEAKAERQAERWGSTEPMVGSGGDVAVNLVSHPPRGKVPVIEALRGFGEEKLALRHAKALVDAAPTLVAIRCEPDEAETLREALEEAGAEAEVRSGLRLVK